MLKSLMSLSAFVALSGCMASQSTVPFSRAQAGDLAAPSNLSVAGVIDTTGVNIYSLFMDEGDRSGTDCIPLILDREGQTRAKRLAGSRAVVSGNAIPMAELNQTMPNQYGEINGREWSGTRCTGRIAIYVTALKTIR